MWIREATKTAEVTKDIFGISSAFVLYSVYARMTPVMTKPAIQTSGARIPSAM